MLESLITSKTRLKLLLKFFFNPDVRSYLRGLADEMGESTNAIRVELDRLTDAGILEKKSDGRKIMYGANRAHPLFPELNSAVRKYFGIDKIIDTILNKLGSVEMAFVTGDYARGIDSGIIDVVIVGKIDRSYLLSLVDIAEGLVNRKIRTLTMTAEEYARYRNNFPEEESILVWDGK